MTDRDSNTLATRGLEEPFFQLCCCISYLFWQEIGFDFTYYLCTLSTIQLWCCVGFFGSGGKLFLELLTYLVYNTVVWLCQFFCCGQKANLRWIFLLNPNFLLVHRNKLSITVYLFLALYGSTTIQSQSFLKNIENFVRFPKQYLLISLF
jgi:hypothetical protein